LVLVNENSDFAKTIINRETANQLTTLSNSKTGLHAAILQRISGPSLELLTYSAINVFSIRRRPGSSCTELFSGIPQSVDPQFAAESTIRARARARLYCSFFSRAERQRRLDVL